jgi:hypothetical protein
VVPTYRGEIALPDVGAIKNQNVAVALQLSGVPKLDDAKFEALWKSNSQWSIKIVSAEMHYFAELDASRAIQARLPKLQEYIAAANNDKLRMVVKAVFVKDAVIEVTGAQQAGVEAALSAEIKPVLASLGFTVSADGQRATALRGTDMYVAIGMRQLTASGLRAAAPAQPTEFLVIGADTPDSIGY